MAKRMSFREFVVKVNNSTEKELLAIEKKLEKEMSTLTKEEISLGRGDWKPSDYFTSKVEGSYTRYAKPENILLNCELIDRQRIVSSTKKNRHDYHGSFKPLPNPGPAKSQAEKLYETFHGKKVTKTKTRNFDTPKALVTLGRAVAIEYECEKINGVKPSRSGKRNIFRHEFPKSNILSSNEKGTILIVQGPKLTIKKSGINH